jgi:hypothetical protein
MTVIPARPKLVLHYAPGVLVVLKRNNCRGRLAGWSSLPKHGPNCGCSGSQETFTTTGYAYWLKSDEVGWCLERSWVDRRRAKVESDG